MLTRVKHLVSPPRTEPRLGPELIERITRARDALVAELRTQLKDADEEHIEDLIAQADEGSKGQWERAQGAERRATTLQGGLSIGVPFILANAGFVFGTNRIGPTHWRVIFAALLLMIALALAIAALRASQATSTIHSWNRPHLDSSVMYRATLSREEARLHVLASLIYSIRHNRPIAQWKIDRLQEALRWFRVAVAILVVLAAVFVVFAATSAPSLDDERATAPRPSASPPAP